MARREYLSPDERARFDTPPPLTAQQRAIFLDLPTWAISYLQEAITPTNRVGFLVRQRRFKRLEGEGSGPRYKQTSNVYWAFLPKFILPFLPRWMRPAPVPACELQREADRCEEQGAMLASLSCRELARAMIGGQLGKILAKLGAGIDAQGREYQNDPQPLTQSYDYRINRISGAGLVGQQRFA